MSEAHQLLKAKLMHEQQIKSEKDRTMIRKQAGGTDDNELAGLTTDFNGAAILSSQPNIGHLLDKGFVVTKFNTE